MPKNQSSSTAGGGLTSEQQMAQVMEGIEHFELPKSVVTKIAKSALPDNAKLQKDTVLALVKGSTVFINYLAATAHDIAVSRQHKSISANDIFKALELVDFNHLTPILEEQFNAYRTLPKNEKGKKNKDANGTSASTSSSTRNPTSTATTTANTTTTTANNNAGAAGTSISASSTTPTPPTGTASASANGTTNGNPYPNVSNRPSNPYPSITPDSPFTSEPLGVSSASANVNAGAGGAPMDVDDDETE